MVTSHGDAFKKNGYAVGVVYATQHYPLVIDSQARLRSVAIGLAHRLHDKVPPGGGQRDFLTQVFAEAFCTAYVSIVNVFDAEPDLWPQMKSLSRSALERRAKAMACTWFGSKQERAEREAQEVCREEEDPDTATLTRCPYCQRTHAPESVEWCRNKPRK